jgi:hypothetical protein
MKCKNYSGQDEDYCKSITTNNTSKYKWTMVNNHYVTQYKYCSTYNNYISSNHTKINKSICESIVVNSDYYNVKKFVQKKNYVLNMKEMMNILVQSNIGHWILIKFVSWKTINV